MDIAFRALLKQIPQPRLVDESVRWRPLMGVRSMVELVLQK
jgi:hypothetical protein